MTSAPIYHLDANVVLRFLLRDHSSHSPVSKRLFRSAEEGLFRLYLSDTALAEIIWVITSFYNFSRNQTAESILGVLSIPGVEVRDFRMLKEVLELFENSNLSYVDAYNATRAEFHGSTLLSFDKGLQRIKKDSVVSPHKVLTG